MAGGKVFHGTVSPRRASRNRISKKESVLRNSLVAVIGCLAFTQSCPAATISLPAVPQPSAPGDVQGMLLRPETAAITAHYMTTGMSFPDGKLPPGSGLEVKIPARNLALAAQIDEKTHWPDGFVRTGVLTFALPAKLSSSTPTGLMLHRIARTTAAPVQLAFPAGSATVTLAMATADVAIDLHALATGAAVPSYWLQGPLVTEARYDVPVANAFHVVLDARLYADGNAQMDVAFANDLALASGGAETYTAEIGLFAATAHQAISAQQPFTNWHRVVSTSVAPPAGNLVHDMAALERTGLVPQFPLTVGVKSSYLGFQKSPASCGPLGSCGLIAYMPTTGARPDIGLLPRWDSIWLQTQNAAAASFALRQADAAGSVPWHDEYFPERISTEAPAQTITLARYPNWWSDDRCPTDFFQGPCSPMSYGAAAQASGITPDAAHMPALAYMAYLMTGSRHYLDEVAAQAGWSALNAWPLIRRWGAANLAYGVTNITNDIIVDPLQQLRDAAWSLREIMMASLIEPDGSELQTYFSAQAAHNFAFAAALAAVPAKGELIGFVDGQYSDSNNGLYAPWENDYLALVAEWGAHAQVTNAATLVTAMAPFLVNRFIQPAAHFSPFDGGAYQLGIGSGTFGKGLDAFRNYEYLASWSEVEAATVRNGTSNDQACLPPVNRMTCFWIGVIGAAAQSTVLDLPASVRTALPAGTWRRAVNWLAANPANNPRLTATDEADTLFLNWQIDP